MDKKNIIVLAILLAGVVVISGCKAGAEGPSTNQSVTDDNVSSTNLTNTPSYVSKLYNKCENMTRLYTYCNIEMSPRNGYLDSMIIYGADALGYLDHGISMLPLIKKGDKLLYKKYDSSKAETLRTCEIIRFKNPNFRTEEYTVHRIIGFDGDKVVARGDNNKLHEIEILTRDMITHRICGVVKVE